MEFDEPGAHFSQSLITPYISMSEEHHRISFMDALRIPNCMTYALCYMCLKAVNYTMFFWLPYFLNNTFSTDISDDIAIVYNVGQILGGWICGWIGDYIRKRSPPVFIFLLIAIVPILLLRIPSSSIIFISVLSFSAGLFIGGPANIISSTISADLGKHPSLVGNPQALATVAGIVDGTGSFGAAACQYAVSWVSDYSWDYVFAILAVLLLMSAALLLKLAIHEIRLWKRYGRKDLVEKCVNFDSNVDNQALAVVPRSNPSYNV